MTDVKEPATGEKESSAVGAVRERFGASVLAAAVNRGQWRIDVARDAAHDVVRFLRDDPALAFEFPVDMTCLDHYPDAPRFRALWVLRNFARREDLVVKIEVPEDDCWAPSMADLYPAFDMIEREAYDMFGVTFRGHPDLRRIMMPEMFEDFPLRKDFPMEGKLTDREWAEWIIARAQRLEGDGT